MSRRGLTLIEMLLALTLLAAIAGVTAAWTKTATQLASSAVEPARLRSAAQAVLEIIHDDLKTGDFVTHDSVERVTCKDGSLRIQTRDRGSVTVHTYRLKPQTETLELLKGDSSNSASIVLVGSATRFDCEIDAARTVLTVAITMKDGAILARRYALP